MWPGRLRSPLPLHNPVPRRLRAFVFARLSPEGAFGLHLTVGVVLMLVAAWLFGNIAADVVSHDDITLLDAWLANWFHGHKHSGWTPFMLFITHMHNTLGILLMVGLFALYLHRRKAHYWLLTVFVTVPGGMLLNVMLKYTFQRARPHFDEPLLTLATYSFPSGHTAGATLLYGVIAAWLICQCRGWLARGAVLALAGCMAGLVGLSRIYLGAHYLSDVLAALVVGCGWLAVSITAISSLRRRRSLASPNGEPP